LGDAIWSQAPNESKSCGRERNRSCCNTRRAPVYTSTHKIRSRNPKCDKLLDGRIGRVEYLVLEYAVTQAESFMPSMVANYVRERYKLNLDPRRVHDAIKRLVRRNVLLKIDRGWYMLNPEINVSEKDLKRIAHKAKNKLRDREVDSLNQHRNDKEDGWGPHEFVRDPIVRVHASYSGPVDLLYLFFICIMILKIMEYIVKYLYNFLRRRGYSVRILREVKREAVRYVENVNDCIIGGHSLYGGGESKTLIPVQKLEKAVYRELGVDLILGVDRAPKIHVKIYTTKNPYKHQPLTEYMELKENEA